MNIFAETKDMKQGNEVDYIYGRNAVTEALDSDRQIDKVFVAQNLSGEYEKELRGRCKESNIPLIKTPADKLKKITRNDQHQGVVAFISPVSFQDLDDVLMLAFEQGKNPSVVILEGVTDVRNVGAIARSAHVMGLDAVIILTKNAGRMNADAVKSSAGALLQIPICREKNMITAVEKLHNYGINVVATDLKTEKYASQTDLTLPTAIIMGSEDKGTTYESIQMANEVVKIPQMSEFDSLNVSVAAGVLMYELVRQRIQSTKK